MPGTEREGMKSAAAKEAAREARRAYHRKWAKENPDKVKAAQERFWNKQAEKAAAEKAAAVATSQQAG